MSNIPTKVRALVRARAENACERCGDWISDFGGAEIHHRKPRGMGGTTDPAIHCPSNLAFVCWPCHAWIESHRVISTELGFIVRRGDVPAELPVSIWERGFVYLDPDGSYVQGSP